MALIDSEKICVLGFGDSGQSTADYLAFAKQAGQTIKVSESRERRVFQNKVVDGLWKEGVDFQFGEHTAEFINEADLIVVSPGIKPRGTIIEELDSSKFITDYDLFTEASHAPHVAITGTNGKTTTASLLGHLIDTAPIGNIGKPFMDYRTAHYSGETYSSTKTPKALPKPYVVELSSFQLYYSRLPEAAKVVIYLNFSPDHLDWHCDLEEYKATKAKLCEHADTEKYIFNFDDTYLRIFGKSLGERVSFFSTREDLSSLEGTHAYMENGAFVLCRDGNKIPVAKAEDMQIVGEHNNANTLASILAMDALDYGLFNLQSKLKTFKAVEHRMELFDTINRKDIYNDSKSTNSGSAIRAYSSFDKCVAFVGGKDKGLEIDDLCKVLMERAEYVYAFGEMRERFAEHLQAHPNFTMVEDLEKAVESAVKLKTESPIVFSPGSSSFDMFQNYEDRGRQFKQLVHLQTK